MFSGPDRWEAPHDHNVHCAGTSCRLRALEAPTLVLSQKYCQYRWEAACCTNRRRTSVQRGGVLRDLPILRLRSREGTAIQIGRVSRNKVEVCCSTLLDKLCRREAPRQCPQLAFFMRNLLVISTLQAAITLVICYLLSLDTKTLRARVQVQPPLPKPDNLPFVWDTVGSSLLRSSHSDWEAAKGGVGKGGVCKRKQTRANADKRKFQALWRKPERR